jgi:hypothetical protein
MPAVSVLRQASGFVETSPDKQHERVENQILYLVSGTRYRKLGSIGYFEMVYRNFQD